MTDKCLDCEYRKKCKFKDFYNFCDDCADYENCTIRFGSTCKAGYEIECNNGFEPRLEDWEYEDE